MGWVLVGMAGYFLKPILPVIMQKYLLPAIAISAGLHLGWLDKTTATFRAFAMVKITLAFAFLAVGTYLAGSQYFVGAAVRWHPYSEQLLADAQEQNKPVIIDFYATWCAPCRELDATVFHHPDVVKLSLKDYLLVKVDLTKQSDRKYDKLLEKYDVKGVPTVVFIDVLGQERRDLRLVDFVGPDAFLNRMVSLR